MLTRIQKFGSLNVILLHRKWEIARERDEKSPRSKTIRFEE